MPARRRTSAATAGVIRVVDASGDSPKSWDAAVIAAVKGSEVRRPVVVEITRMWAKWDGEKPSRYLVTVRIAYRQSLKPSR